MAMIIGVVAGVIVIYGTAVAVAAETTRATVTGVAMLLAGFVLGAVLVVVSSRAA